MLQQRETPESQEKKRKENRPKRDLFEKLQMMGQRQGQSPMMDPPRRENHGFQMPPQTENNGFQLPPQMTAPPLVNAPPQYFGGGYTNDGLSSMNPDTIFAEADRIFMDDTADAKRRRIARACDMCRKKKIKCDGLMPKCGHCMNYKTECNFTQQEKKRATPKGAKYIESIENRLVRMENLIRLSGILGEDDNGKTDLEELEKDLEKKFMERREPQRLSEVPGSGATSPSGSTPNEGDDPTSLSAVASPAGTSKSDKRKSATPSAPGVEEISEQMESLVTNNCGETRYIGASSGFSIFSPKGIEWVNEKTGDHSFKTMIQEASVDENKWMYWKPEVFGDLFQRKIFQPLPPKVECMILLKNYFQNFNCMFPLFHQPTFMHLTELQYSSTPYEGSGWWASLNVALAISHRVRVMSGQVPKDEDETAWGYLKNAIGVFTELTMRNTDLLSVQALLGMALFLQGTPNPQPSFFLVAAAMRLAHSIGLHKRGSGFNLNPVEIEQRKRVFWIAYMLDKDICIRSGRPPAHDDDDMNVDLPDPDPVDDIGNIPLAEGKGKLNLFRTMCEFAVIESKVYKKLYSVKASKQTDGELLHTIGEMDHLLEEWKDNIPVDFRPEHEINADHTPLKLHVVVLHLSYYNCLTTIHRMSIHHGFWSNRLADYAQQGRNTKPLNPRVFSSAALCVAAARSSIALLKYIPQGDFSCVWLILYFPVSALVTLFGNILQNPTDPRARADLRLMNMVVNFLGTLVVAEENGGVKRMLGVCSEFERIATVMLDKEDKRVASKKKRKNEEHQSLKAQGHTAPLPRASMTGMTQPTAMATVFSPGMAQMQNGYGSSPMTGQGSPGSNWQPDFVNGNGSEYMTPSNGYTNGNDITSPINGDLFQQPFVPQDLWQMPMSMEWDWADMTGGEYPGWENGLSNDPQVELLLQDIQQSTRERLQREMR